MNDITTGSMYAVTLDSQNITAEELRSVYDETVELRNGVTEENVYSEKYLGKLLALAGKLYFAQVDIADTLAADMYDVSVTRNLSEGITGYEVRTSSLYGMVTGLSEGNFYIDVDMDSYGVVSLRGDKAVSKKYMMTTGIISSAYESIVWEQMAGKKGISAVSVLAKAQEEGKELLVIGKLNLSEEIVKLNVDETTEQEVVNAVNSGNMVIIPNQEVKIDNWIGTGYIVMNPQTGAGAYMISGGLNGGTISDAINVGFIVSEMYLNYTLILTLESLVSFIEIMSCELLFGGWSGIFFGLGGVGYMLKSVIKICDHLTAVMQLYYEYILEDSEENALAFLRRMKEIFADNFFSSLAKDTAVDYLRYFYTWGRNGGALY